MGHNLPSLLLVHAEMCENWGYEKLSEYSKKQSIGEMKHAEALMECILFLVSLHSRDTSPAAAAPASPPTASSH